jgi:hypothetical protein
MQPAQLGSLQPPQQVTVGQPQGLTPGPGGVDMLRAEGFSVGRMIFGCVVVLFSCAIIAVIVVVAMSGPRMRMALAGVFMPIIFFFIGVLILVSITATNVQFDRNQQVVTVSKRYWVPCRCTTTQNIPFSHLGAMTCTQHRPATQPTPQTVTLELAYQGMQGAGLTLLCRPVSGAESTLQLEWATYLATLCPGPAGMLPAPVVTPEAAMVAVLAAQMAAMAAQPMLMQPMMMQPGQPVAMQQEQLAAQMAAMVAIQQGQQAYQQQGDQQQFAHPQMYAAAPPLPQQSYGEQPYGVM